VKRAGYILVEVSISYLILALAITALVPAFILTLKANKNTEKIVVAANLSRELLEEIRVRRYDENTSVISPLYISTGTAVGLDAGETAADKTTFDDIDDFDGWVENGAQDPGGNALPDFSAYTRTATVKYVVYSTWAVSGSTTDYKMVTACTTTAGLSAAGTCVNTIVANR
jgi:hypothetical protein